MNLLKSIRRYAWRQDIRVRSRRAHQLLKTRRERTALRAKDWTKTMPDLRALKEAGRI